MTSSLGIVQSSSRYSYQRLKDVESGFEELIEYRHTREFVDRERRRSIGRSRSRRFGRMRFKKVKIRSVSRFLMRKARIAIGSWNKLIQRLKESRPHLEEIFAGNYMFLQVSPKSLQTPNNLRLKSQFSYLDRPSNSIAGGNLRLIR